MYKRTREEVSRYVIKTENCVENKRSGANRVEDVVKQFWVKVNNLSIITFLTERNVRRNREETFHAINELFSF